MNKPKMLQHIHMPAIVRAMCGATIGFLIGMYLVNTFFAGNFNWVFYLCVVLGAAAGIWLFRR